MLDFGMQMGCTFLVPFLLGEKNPFLARPVLCMFRLTVLKLAKQQNFSPVLQMDGCP